ncbi:MAG: magnesium transporter [Glaciecola sp.]
MNFHGLDDLEMLQVSFQKFGIHRLTQQDILTLNERPKIEEFEGHLFVTMKSAYWKNKSIESEQISFILTNSNLISYQEKEEDIFNEIRFKITNSTGIVRKRTADYLLYLLVDAVILGYQKVLSKIQDRVDALQLEIREDFDKTLFHQIDFEKEQLKFLKKTILPIRDQINKLITGDNVFIKEKNKPYFNDLKDQILYLVDEIDSERSDLESMSNMYFAALSQKSNEIMQFLTIVAAIFIPLTFVAGVYGMNFKYIPELDTEYGYFVFWGVMLTITGGLVLYFRKKNWF